MNEEYGARAKSKKPRRQPRAVALGGLVAVAVVAAVLLGGWTNSTSARATTSAKKAAAQAVTLYVFRGETGIKGPDGKGHDAFVPSSFAVKSGSRVTVTVVNYDEGLHSMTAPGVGLDASITGGKALSNGKIGPVTTHFTFTPTTKGTFRWYCKIPCDKGANYWAMEPGYDGPSENGFMAGYIVVI
jgi:plastocyanin